jgi:hypothetical protein
MHVYINTENKGDHLLILFVICILYLIHLYLHALIYMFEGSSSGYSCRFRKVRVYGSFRHRRGRWRPYCTTRPVLSSSRDWLRRVTQGTYYAYIYSCINICMYVYTQYVCVISDALHLKTQSPISTPLILIFTSCLPHLIDFFYFRFYSKKINNNLIKKRDFLFYTIIV